MSRNRLPSVFVPALLAAFGAPLAAAAAESGAPVPLDVAYSRREIQRFMGRGHASHDGRWLAYDLYTPPLKSPGSELEAEPRILPNGTPAHVVGMNVVVADTETGKERPVCGEKQNCWRPSWSPDDKQLAYFSDAGGVAQVYVYELATSRSRRLADVRVKAKLWPGDEAAWSPDGREVFVPVELHPPEPEPSQVKPPKDPTKPSVTVYKTKEEEPPATAAAPGATPEAMLKHFIRENNATLAAIDLASGKMRVLVPADTEPRPSCMRISPDGKWISYLSIFKMKGETASETYYDLVVASAAGGAVRVVAPDVNVNEDGEYFGSTYRWLPGNRIVFLKGKRLWLADVEGAAGREPRPLSADLGNLTDEPLLVTADGRAVLVGLEALGKKTYYHVPPRALALVPLDGSAARTFSFTGTPLGAQAGVLWQPDSGHFFALLRDAKKAERTIVRVDRASGQTQTVWKGMGRFETAGAGPGGKSWIFRYESTDTPADYYRYDERFSKRTRVSRVEPRLDQVRVGPMQAFVTKVPGYDGQPVEVTTAAFLPADRKPGQRFPTIVYFYGGSQVLDNAQEYGGGATNSIPAVVFTTRGYAVLLVDVPLSPEGTAGGNPIQEMGAVIPPQVRHAIELGITDPKRVAIMGQSYGGYGTASVITQTDLFSAAIALDGLYDLPGSFATMGPGGSTFNFVWSETGQGRMGTHPWADLKRYLANSPYYLADKIHTPLLLVHGKIDKTCPVEGAERMFNALKRLDRKAELAVYDGEGHVPGTWSLVNAVDATNRMLQFLTKHMGPEEEKR